MEPRKEYQARLARWSEKAEACERTHLRMGNLRLLGLVVLLVLLSAVCRTWLLVGVGFSVLTLALFLSGMAHDRILNARDTARRAIGIYRAGLDRLSGAWAGKGSPGTEFLDPHHPYAADLDLFGPGSLFELLNAAQTQSGRATLAHWLLRGACSEEILARQAAVEELRPRLDLRERMGLLAAEAEAWIRTTPLVAWGRQARLLDSKLARVVIFSLPWLGVALIVSKNWWWALASLGIEFAVACAYKHRVRKVTRSLALVQGDLRWLAELLRCVEGESFQSERLQQMNAECERAGVSASCAIQRLALRYDWLASADNLFLKLVAAFFLWETQFAFAIEVWRARFGTLIETWIARLAEMEALCSLARYSYEHPADPFPELLPATAPPQLHAEALGHALIPESRCVPNDVSLGSNRRLLIVSGSNMSGKSTYLRAIGINLVLALAGGPVRARRVTMTPLQLGASIRIVDSLQEGTSRFYAEIQRLGEIVKLASEQPPLVFLLDEMLGGTNSRDRRIGAECVARSLVQRGAIGLITTHDLALTRIADDIQPPGANAHFEDQFQDGRMTFDYRLRPGVIQKSNALELMRSVGLDVSVSSEG